MDTAPRASARDRNLGEEKMFEKDRVRCLIMFLQGYIKGVSESLFRFKGVNL